MDEMDVCTCEDVDAATGQKTAAESGKRKRQRVDITEEPVDAVSQLDGVESAPAKKKVGNYVTSVHHSEPMVLIGYLQIMCSQRNGRTSRECWCSVQGESHSGRASDTS